MILKQLFFFPVRLVKAAGRIDTREKPPQVKALLQNGQRQWLICGVNGWKAGVVKFAIVLCFMQAIMLDHASLCPTYCVCWLHPGSLGMTVFRHSDISDFDEIKSQSTP